MGVDDGAFCRAEHLFAGNVYFLDATVVKFAQLAVKHHFNVLLTMLAIDLVQLIL